MTCGGTSGDNSPKISHIHSFLHCLCIYYSVSWPCIIAKRNTDTCASSIQWRAKRPAQGSASEKVYAYFVASPVLHREEPGKNTCQTGKYWRSLSSCSTLLSISKIIEKYENFAHSLPSPKMIPQVPAVTLNRVVGLNSICQCSKPYFWA